MNALNHLRRKIAELLILDFNLYVTVRCLIIERDSINLEHLHNKHYILRKMISIYFNQRYMMETMITNGLSYSFYQMSNTVIPIMVISIYKLTKVLVGNFNK